MLTPVIQALPFSKQWFTFQQIVSFAFQQSGSSPETQYAVVYRVESSNSMYERRQRNATRGRHALMLPGDADTYSEGVQELVGLGCGDWVLGSSA